MKRLGLYAGGDWSGKPDHASGNTDIYTFAVAAFPDEEPLNDEALAVRRELGMPLGEEFHGHEMSDGMNAAVLEMGLRLEMRVGVLMVNKSEIPSSGRLALPAPARFTHEISLRLLGRFMPLCPLRRLWVDEDIKGRTAQQNFETEVRQMSRAIHPTSTCRAGFRRSHTNIPVQMADVVAYVLSRWARRARSEPILENVVRKLRDDSRHLILGPLPWED